MEIEQEIIGFSPEGEVIIRYTLTNNVGIRVQLLNIGAAVTSIEVPDREGNLRHVLLGYPSYKDYLADSLNMGKFVGRYAGRIAKSRFKIEDTTYKLSSNEGTTHVNGGVHSFAGKIWTARTEKEMVVFSYVSAVGEEGYPSELGLEVGYSLGDDSLQVTVVGEADGDTIANIAPYFYFNLGGKLSDWELKINSSSYVTLSNKLLPLGIESVDHTTMDFKKFKVIEDDYDGYWMVDHWNSDVLNDVCTLRSSSSGIELQIYSSQRALFFSDCSEIEGCGVDHKGDDLENYAGVLLSPQNISDFSDNEMFVSPILRVGDTYHHNTIYKFKNF